MNKFIYLAATAATLLAVACNKQNPSERLSDRTFSESSGTGTLEIQLNQTMTKAVDLQDTEKAINKFIVCIFCNDTGKLEMEPYEVSPQTSVSTITLDKIPFGNKTVAMAVNYSERPNTESFEKFMKSVSDLKDNSASNLVMTAYNENVSIAGGENKITMTLKRIAAKIHVGKIKAAYSSDSKLNNPTVFINGVYIGNAAKTASLAGKFAGNLYNQYTPSENFTVDPAVETITAANGFELSLSTSFQNIDKYLYTYPYSDSETPSYLIIGAFFNGVQRYYRYTLPEIKSNTLYNIEEITVTGAPDSSALEITISVGNWDEDNSMQQISL